MKKFIKKIFFGISVALILIIVLALKQTDCIWICNGELTNFKSDSLVHVAVGPNLYRVTRLSYFNRPGKKVNVGEEVTLAFIHGKRQMVLGKYGPGRLVRVVFFRQLYHNFKFLAGIGVIAFLMYCRFTRFSPFFMDLKLNNSKSEKLNNSLLC